MDGTDAIEIEADGGALTVLNFERAGNHLVIGYNGQQLTVGDQAVPGKAVESITFTGGATFLVTT